MLEPVVVSVFTTVPIDLTLPSTGTNKGVVLSNAFDSEVVFRFGSFLDGSVVRSSFGHGGLTEVSFQFSQPSQGSFYEFVVHASLLSSRTVLGNIYFCKPD